MSQSLKNSWSTKPTEFQQKLNVVDVDTLQVGDQLPPNTLVINKADSEWGYGHIRGEKASQDKQKAKTYDEGKEPLAWLPWAAIDELSKVQIYGHGKYSDFNNYKKGMEVSRNLSCALRHIRDYLQGRDQDAESACHPLAHALCRIAFVLENIHDGTAIDDRYRVTKPLYQEVVDGENLIKEWGRQKP